MEPLSFDSPAEADVVRRFPTYAKVLCPPRPGLEPDTTHTATAHSSHSATEAKKKYIYIYLTSISEEIYLDTTDDAMDHWVGNGHHLVVSGLRSSSKVNSVCKEMLLYYS